MGDEEEELLGFGELLNPGVTTLIYATDPWKGLVLLFKTHGCSFYKSAP